MKASDGEDHQMLSCDHEADTRIVVHVRHAIQNGANAVPVCMAGTDVVIRVGKIHKPAIHQP